jgi:hypothetical protein
VAYFRKTHVLLIYLPFHFAIFHIFLQSGSLSCINISTMSFFCGEHLRKKYSEVKTTIFYVVVRIWSPPPLIPITQVLSVQFSSFLLKGSFGRILVGLISIQKNCGLLYLFLFYGGDLLILVPCGPLLNLVPCGPLLISVPMVVLYLFLFYGGAFSFLFH